MTFLIGVVIGGLIGFFTAAVFGAGKVQDLEIDNHYYRDQCVRLRAKLALKDMGEEKPTEQKEWCVVKGCTFNEQGSCGIEIKGPKGE
jgi:hypothetical protein